jgi:hypothetical protein
LIYVDFAKNICILDIRGGKNEQYSQVAQREINETNGFGKAFEYSAIYAFRVGNGEI